MTAATAPAGRGHEPLIASLATRIREALEPLVPRGRPVALVDFPRTPNVGDSLIWLGALAWLADSGRGAPRHTCGVLTYEARALARAVGRDGVILLTGGGNLGDLYEGHQRLREQVIADFPGHPIVQLPQTIHFESRDALERARRVFDAHPALTLLVRDAPSLALARASFRAPSVMCPDMSLCLGALPRPVPSVPVVWLSRHDKESAARGPVQPPPGVRPQDWLLDDPAPVVRLNRLLARRIRRHPRLRPWIAPMLAPMYGAVARSRLERGRRILGAGRVVVTNRLHGHILSLLLGIPHFLLDNSYGKVRAFHEAWTSGSEQVRFCESESEALRLAMLEAGVGD